MDGGTHGPRLHMRNRVTEQKTKTVIPKGVTVNDAVKPARITKRQLGPVLALLKRVAQGGDATTAVDAARLVPFVERALAAAPAGQRAARDRYRVTQPTGAAAEYAGLAETARALGRAKSTVANALTKGGGKALFNATDEHGNPAVVEVEKLARSLQ